MGAKMAKTLNFNPKNSKADQALIEIANNLARLTNRKSVDALRQFVLHYGPIRVAELEKQKVPQSA